MPKAVDWFKKVHKAISEEFGLRKDLITPEVAFDALHLDADNRMDLLATIDPTLDEDDAYAMKTVAELVTYLETHRPNGPHTHPFP